uniref:Anaphase-promoting complex subunit 4 n=1 Tax=Sphenodon punctatus TaxID=8508 RepID=A0A8D0L9C3_SPHPU
ESNLLLPKLPALPKNVLVTHVPMTISPKQPINIINLVMIDSLINFDTLYRLNALVLGGNAGFIEIYAYGMYKIATVTAVAGSCLGLCLSSDLKSLSVITEVQTSPDSEPEVTYFQLDTSLLSTYLPEVTRMARKFTHISTLLQYIKLSLTCMCEAWEEILMQMDSRLTKFVQEKNTTTSVQDEFMQLLLWGKASLELQALLMNQLTVKGLKKLGHSIESSYSSIQKLVISHLQSSHSFHVDWKNTLISPGLAFWHQEIKLESSMQMFGVLLGSVHTCALNNMSVLNDLHFPLFLSQMTQKDITFVADFLTEHFNESPELYNRKGKYFNVERVGQYLKDEDDELVSPPNTEGNQWFNFIQNSTHLKESPLLFPYYPQKSLHFVKRRMEGIIDQCLQKPADVIGKSVHQAVCMPLYKASKSEDPTPRLFKLPFLWNDKFSNLHYVLFTMLENSISKICILRRRTDISRPANNGLLAVDFGSFLNSSLNESSSTSLYSCLDAHFYDDNTITVVLKENAEQEGKERILAQLHLSSVYTAQDQGREFSWNSCQRLDEQCDAIPTRTVVLESQWRVLENMKAQYVAVNGIRKVSCVLSSNLRHVRVFEMDVEDDVEVEEEEEEETTQNVSGEQGQLNQSVDKQESVCVGSVELADETEEHELSLDS